MIGSSSYAAQSALTARDQDTLLALETGLGATPTGLVEHPSFFSGLVARPDVVAAGLLAVADVAATRYFDAAAMLKRNLDPVVTASGDRLRFESLSACNGVYARLDLMADGIDSGEVGFGTTNVDINQPLRTALAGVGSEALLHLGVGADELRVSTLDSTHVERKVDMPDRWIRGFAEVPSIAAACTPAIDVPARVARPFLATLSRAAPGPTTAVLLTPRGLRTAAPSTPGALRLTGTARLGAARRVQRFLQRLEAFAGPDGASGWVLHLPGARLTLLLTAAPFRGFSGEGGLLHDLMAGADPSDVSAVHEFLTWDPVVDPSWLGAATGLSAPRVDAALTLLATSGLLGYDLVEQSWFHRDLPHDDRRQERDNPRLVKARRLVAKGHVDEDRDGRWVIGSEGQQSWVVLDGTASTCTCRWFGRHGVSRGPCAHVLAADLAASAAQRDGRA